MHPQHPQRLALIIFVVQALAAGSLLAQGTFVYDQQSSTDETPPHYSAGGDLTLNAPWGQSFTPQLFLVEFVRLKFDDGNLTDGLGATVYVNLRSDSLTGTILGTTDPVTMPRNFAGVTNFFFTAPVTVTPGTTYFFEPVQSAGGTWLINGGPYLYPGGIAYQAGAPEPGADLWFREGIIPEPSWLCLVLVGGAVLVGAKLRTEGRRVRD